MLVLSRKKNESIVIDDDITLVIVGIEKDKVRLGIEAPTDVSVHRKEVDDAVQKNSEHIKTEQEYQQFRKYLSLGKFKKAYEMFSDNNDLGTREEIDLMVYGLNLQRRMK